MKATKNSPAKAQPQSEELRLDLLPLNHLVGMPSDLIGFSLQNKALVDLVEKNYHKKKRIFCCCIKLSDRCDSRFGVTAEVEGLQKKEGELLRFKLRFFERAEVLSVSKAPSSRVKVRILKRKGRLSKTDKAATTTELEELLKQYSKYVDVSHLSKNIDLEDFDSFLAKVSRSISFSQMDRQRLITGWGTKNRLALLIDILVEQIEVRKARQQIKDKTTKRIRDFNQQAFLREEKRVIEKELGEDSQTPPEYLEIKKKIDHFKGPESTKIVLQKEFKKLCRSGPGSPQTATTQDYLETLLDLPWDVSISPQTKWLEVESSLKKSHFGLDKIKERIFRYLASTHISSSQRGPILCFIGPPGVGKTSMARAISEALSLPFIRKSMGGVHDESEIRGHRRTYIGSLPGRIIQGLKKVGCNNPVFCLDEVDKIGRDHRGSPADALLEVLDSEENAHFSDHYLEVEFDLSKVFWVLTANSEAGIPLALRDRLEIIHFSSYTESEKVHIAKDHLMKRNREKLGMTDFELKLSDSLLKKLIRDYTREAGVRELDRKLGDLYHDLALQYVRKKGAKKRTLALASLSRALGSPPVKRIEWKKSSFTAGFVAGLAWTAAGGTILKMEGSKSPGKGVLKLTGKLGDVLKESAHIALSFVKRNSQKLGIDHDELQKSDFHIHLPAGAVSKDGPSAGLGLTLLIHSILSGQRMKPFWAVTGEISLLGRVLPVGGIKEKILAAQQEGFVGVVLPMQNQTDVKEIPARELGKLKIHYVKNFNEAHRYLFK